jgi:UDP-glucose 4-epimerase
MNILVTGGAGYVGSHTCLTLKDEGHAIIVIDTLERGFRKAVVADAFYQGDIADTQLVQDIIYKHKIEAVMHFAAYAYVEESVREPSKYFQNNIVATLSMCVLVVMRDIRPTKCDPYFRGLPAKPCKPVRVHKACG